MSLKVIFENGLEISYPEANFVSNYQNYTDLYTKENGTWIAQVPNSCVIQTQKGDARYINNINTYPHVNTAIDFVMLMKEEASVYQLAKLKSALRKFDAKTKQWKK